MGSCSIGVFGGTFDPVHFGHLKMAEAVQRELDLVEVVFVPAGSPWLKQDRDVTSAEHRLEMLVIATASYPRFNVSTLEMERPGATYTVETMSELRASLGASTQVFFIVGFDALNELPAWKEPERLVNMCRIAAVRRPGHTDLDMDELEAAVPGLTKSLVVVDAPLVNVSATEIRERAAQGRSIRDMVPEEVAEYIEKNRLYRDGGTRGDNRR